MRISIEWSRLYPQRGQLDQSAVDTYNRMFDCMERCAPAVHHTQPCNPDPSPSRCVSHRDSCSALQPHV